MIIEKLMQENVTNPVGGESGSALHAATADVGHPERPCETTSKLNMDTHQELLRVKGRAVKVAAVQIDGQTVIATGRWLRVAAVMDEEWMEGDVVTDPESFVSNLRTGTLKADIFTFRQSIADAVKRYPYPVVWDNLAVVPINTYADWWEGLPQVTRKNARRAAKRGVTAKVVPFDDELVRGTVEINNDTRERQGHQFWHFGKDAATVKEEYSSFLDRSTFVGAYFGNELIGVIKVVRLGQMASILQILSKSTHYDKRPMNAMLAKVVEICADQGLSHLIYGKYTYGNKKQDGLTEFKHRNGFHKTLFPQYYIPLTLKGRLAVRFNLQLGLIGILPGGLLAILLSVRARMNRMRLKLAGAPRADGARGC